MVDDFGVKYQSEADVQHLLSVLEQDYTVATDWEGAKYAGVSLDWNCSKREVYLSIPGYCKEALVRFGHNLRKANDQPHKHALPVYRQTIQYAKEAETTPPIDDSRKEFIQQVTGIFLLIIFLFMVYFPL